MYVSSMDVEDAVLKVFAQLRVPVGGRLSYAALVKEWPRTYLRHADLAESVQRLVRLHQIEATHSISGHYLMLTDAGLARMQQLEALRMPSWIWRVRMRLLRLWRMLLAGESHPQRRRRLRDRVAPQL